MAIVVFDDFTRPDDPTSLGTATSGQTWVPYDETWTPGDTRWGILSNQAARLAGGNPSVGGGGYALVESGIFNCVIRVTIKNPNFGGDLNNSNFGIVFRYQSTANYFIATWSRAGKFLRICQIGSGGFAICTNEGYPGANQIQAGDVLEVRCCGDLIQGYLNGVLTVTTSTFIGSPGGTQHGLQCGTGVIQDAAYALYDDFTVETNLTCEGSVWTIPSLTWTAEGTVSSDFPTGGVRTLRFDQGSGSEWYIASSVSDSGDELRSKQLKATRATGRFTNAAIKLYTYDVGDPVDVSDLEDGTNSTTGALALTDTTQVTQSERIQTNCPNAVLSAWRIEGNNTGQLIRDRVDEGIVEIVDQGVRR